MFSHGGVLEGYPASAAAAAVVSTASKALLLTPEL